jgi:hypothetical protein
MSDEYTVSLNELEKRLAVYIGRQRTAINRTVTSANHNLAHKDPAKADIEGAMGEMAFCKLLNTYPHDVFELSTRSAATGEDYGDVTMNGLRIDVKTTAYKSARLLASTKNPNVDIIVLMTGEEGVYTLSGGMIADELYKDSRYGIHVGLRKPCFSAEHNELTSPGDVFKTLLY